MKIKTFTMHKETYRVCKRHSAESNSSITVYLKKILGNPAQFQTLIKPVQVIVPACSECHSVEIGQYRNAGLKAGVVWLACIILGFSLTFPDDWLEGLIGGFGIGFFLQFLFGKGTEREWILENENIQEMLKEGWSVDHFT